MNIVPAFVRKKIEHRPSLLKIVDNIGWLFFDKVLRMGVGLLVGVWVARYLGPIQFGLFSFATAFVGMFGVVAGLGLQSIVVRDIVYDPRRKDETLGSAAVLLLIGGLLGYGLLMATIFWFRPDDTLAKLLVAILGSILLFKPSEAVVFWFDSQVQSKYIVWVQNSVFLVFAVIKVALILNHSSLIGFAWATLAEALLVALLLGVMLGLRGPKLQQLRITLGRTKTLLRDSWPLLLSGISIMIYMRIDQIMLGEMAGDEAVGIFSTAVRISEIWYFIPMAIVASISPAILEAKKRSEAQYYKRLQQLYDLMVWFSVAVGLPMTLLATPIVILLFGEAFASAGPVLAIHIWAGVFVFLGVASGQWFLAENRQILGFQRTAIGAVVNIVLNLLLIPRFGAVGSAVATLISQAIAAWLSDAVQPVTRKMFVMKTMSMNPLRLIGLIRLGGSHV